MTNPVFDLTTYSGDDWEEYLDTLALKDVFDELIVEYIEEPTLLTCIIRFIVWAYGKDSPKIVIGSDWLSNKKRIYEQATLSPEEDIQRDVLYLKNKVVLKTIQKWLLFQDEPVWKELVMLKDLRLELQMSANGQVKKSTGEIDYDQKFKNAKYSIELNQMIKDTEARLLQNDERLKEGIKEVRKAATKSRVTISPESFSK